MKLDERITRRLKELVELGERVLATKKLVNIDPRNVVAMVDEQLAHRWSASTHSLLASVFGEQSDYYQGFSAIFQDPHRRIFEAQVRRGQGILLGAQSEYLDGGIFKVRHLVEAELFDDMLSQADHLHEHSYYQAAAVIAGAVLEDTLRKMCQRANIALPDRPKVDSMNADLARQDVYDKLVQKQVTVWADLRNKAAHGEWDKFRSEDVEAMLRDVRRFVSERLP